MNNWELHAIACMTFVDEHVLPSQNALIHASS